MRSKQSRKLWKHFLASTVVALSVAPVCEAQQRGRLMDAILERFDTDGDGRLSADERDGMRNRGNVGAVDTSVPNELKSLYKVSPGPHQVDSITSLTVSYTHLTLPTNREV